MNQQQQNCHQNKPFDLNNVDNDANDDDDNNYDSGDMDEFDDENDHDDAMMNNDTMTTTSDTSPLLYQQQNFHQNQNFQNQHFQQNGHQQHEQQQECNNDDDEDEEERLYAYEMDKTTELDTVFVTHDLSGDLFRLPKRYQVEYVPYFSIFSLFIFLRHQKIFLKKNGGEITWVKRKKKKKEKTTKLTLKEFEFKKLISNSIQFIFLFDCIWFF